MKIFTSLLFILLFSLSLTAQENTGKDAAKSGSKPATSIKSITGELKKFDGYFPFYYDEKTGKIYLEIDKLNEEFLYFGSLSNGIGNGIERGQSSSFIVKFVKMGAKIMLVEPNYDYRAVNGNADEKKAVDNAFAKSIIWGFAAAAIEGKKVLIDFTPFLIRDSQKIGERLSSRGFQGPGAAMTGASTAGGGGTFKMDESRSAVDMGNTKNFPKNTEFEATITFTGGSAGTRGGLAPDANAITANMHQAFIELPDRKYKGRKFDPRSGFNPFSYMDFSAPMTEPVVKRFTRRHRLEKKNPNAAVSEAVEPIVYYIDRGAPAKIKKALIEGGAWWNQAFEAAGFKDAFQVKELPEGVDPMDIRYNVVNWINRSGSPRAFSYGSSYIDPRTGEIIKGVVTLGADRHRQDYLIAEGLLQPYTDGKPVPEKMEQMALARIRQLSAHEIGHTLGLYHNFTSSTKDRASVMDYPFPRAVLKNDGTIEVSDAYAKGIGSWDKRAIMWGYSEFPKNTDENAALDKIMNETLKQGHIFIPDIGGYVHPLSHQWDDGTDPVAQLNNLMKIRRHVLDTFSEKAIQKDAPMATLQEVLVPMYLFHRYQIEAVSKYIGGLYFTHALKNDGQTITEMVEPAEQWKAFDALMTTISPDALALSENLIKKIPPRPVGYPAGMETFSGHTGPTFDPIAAAESAASTTLSYLLNSERAVRLVEYEARDAKQPGLMPVLDKIIAQTWKAPSVPGYKGELQTLVRNLTTKYLLQLAADNSASETVRGQALFTVEELKKWLTLSMPKAQPKVKASMLFALSQIHEFSKSPEKFKPAPATEMPPGAPIGMGGMDFLENGF